MRKSLIIGLMLVAISGGLAQAQTPATNSPAAAASGAMTLQPHWEPGNEIFDSDGKRVGFLGNIKADGSIVLWIIDSSTSRVLPAGTVRWTGTRLMANLTADAIGRLPAG